LHAPENAGQGRKLAFASLIGGHGNFALDHYGATLCPVAGAKMHRERLTGHQRDVDSRTSGLNGAVQWDRLAGADSHDLAGIKFAHRDGHRLAVAKNPRHRCPGLHQLFQLVRGRGPRVRLEITPKGNHGQDGGGHVEIKPVHVTAKELHGGIGIGSKDGDGQKVVHVQHARAQPDQRAAKDRKAHIAHHHAGQHEDRQRHCPEGQPAHRFQIGIVHDPQMCGVIERQIKHHHHASQ